MIRNTDQVYSEQNHQLDVEYIQEKLDEGFKYTEEAKGCDLVLVIGNTGVGKSTTCNYLMGQEMKQIYHSGSPVIETVHTTDIKIGHEVKAETLYAKSIIVEGFTSFDGESKVCLLDCPGFLGNRSIEDRVIESISTELAIRNAQQIRGILILISLHTLRQSRVPELRELVKTLISLLKDPVEMVQYSVFIITNRDEYMPENVAKDITLGKLLALKTFCEDQAKLFKESQNLKSSEGLTYIDYDRIATYFSEVLKRDKFVFIAPLDKGESRKLILDQIYGIKRRKGYLKKIVDMGIALFKYTANIEPNDDQNLQPHPITIDDFNFTEHDEYRFKFNTTLYDRAHDGQLLINKIQGYKAKASNLCKELDDHESRLSTLSKLKCNLQKDIQETEEEKILYLKSDFKSMKTFQSLIDENKNHIKSYEDTIKKNNKSIQELHDESKNINTDKALIFMEKKIYKVISIWRFFGWENMVFNADIASLSIPIIRVDKEMSNGYWKDEVDQKDLGIYTITYESKYRARPAEASVKAFIKTKDEPGNRIRIQEIIDEIAKLERDETLLRSEITKTKSINADLLLTIDQAKNDKEKYEKNLRQKFKECEIDIESHNLMIVKKRQDRSEALSHLLLSLKEFFKNRRKFDIIVNISALLEFPSSLIKSFVSQYKAFLYDTDIDGKENAVKSAVVPNRKNNEKINFKDPISGDEIKDFVVTTKGTIFDEHSLLEQFDTSEKVPLEDVESFIFKHKNGSLEEIRYLSWNKVPDFQNYFDTQKNHSNFSQHSNLISPLTKNEMSNLDFNKLKEKENEIMQKIQALKDELEFKETELNQIRRELGKKVKPEIED